MPKQNVDLISFNRGVITKLALARTDLKRTLLSAEEQSNWMPRVLGSMMLRPGMEYKGNTKGNNFALAVKFIFSNSDTASIEMTDQAIRVLVDDVPLSREAVTTDVTDGDFAALTGWTQDNDSGATSAVSSGKLNLTGTNFGSARIRQEVSVTGANIGKQHTLDIKVDRGPVKLRVGSTSGGDEYIFETTLGTGVHNIAFTPTGPFWIEFFSFSRYKTIVDYCEIGSDGTLVIATPYAEEDLKYIRYSQSADVLFITCKGYPQKRIERRENNSWSLVDYETLDGPFRLINTSQTSITPSGLNGDITLTASEKLFRDTNVGSLYELTSSGQNVENLFNGENQEGDYIRVTGVGSAQRTFTRRWTGAITAVVTLQRSSAEPGSWIDVTTYTNPADGSSATYYDGSTFANQIVYYRFVIKSGDYTSGSTEAELEYDDGGIVGVVRITGFTDQKNVDAVVLRSLGGTDGTTDWAEGKWSDRRGFPTVDIFHEGRKWFFKKGEANASISDAFNSFDTEQEGDSGPIDRSIGYGSVDDAKWALSLSRLIVGTESGEVSIKSSSLDEPITADNFNFRKPSTQGSADVAAIQVDDRGFFVQKSKTKLYELAVGNQVNYDYNSTSMMELVPEIGEPEIVRIDVQRQPDTRIHCVRSDGKVAILVNEPAEDVLCWILFETDGFVEEVEVYPGDVEDSVYYTVRRVVDGVTVRYREKWAMESEARGGELNKQADSFSIYDGTPKQIMTGLDYLEGKAVVVWGDGKDLGEYTVDTGSITLTEAVSKACIGLCYEARFKSAKLAYAAAGGTALTKVKTFSAVGLILANTHMAGLQYGQSFDCLEDLPKLGPNDERLDKNHIYDELDMPDMEVDHEWSTDTRLCLRAKSPRPCTVLAAVIDVHTNG